MSILKTVTSAPLSASYSLTQFSTEWELLLNQVKALVMELEKNSASSRKAFEPQLNDLEFEQIALTSRVSSLSGNDNAGAQAKIGEIENLFNKAAQLMCPKQAPTTKMQIIREGLVEGFVGGIIGGAVKHVATAISIPRIPESNSGSLSEAQANALLAAHNNQVLNQHGYSLNNLATGPITDGPCFPEPTTDGSIVCTEGKSVTELVIQGLEGVSHAPY